MAETTLELITPREAAALTGKHEATIRAAIRNNKIDRYSETGRIKIDKNQVLEWAKNKTHSRKSNSQPWNMILDFDESLRLIEGVHNPNNAVKPARYMFTTKYAVSNKGNVYELAKGIRLTPSLTSEDYLQVSLCADGKRLDERIHVLTAFAWCPNAKFKHEVHHINGIKTDNRADNLIWITKAEHAKAHKLLSDAKNKGDFTEYDEYIAQIRAENQWQGEYRGLIFDKEYKGLKSAIYVWITKEAYEDYRSGTRSLNEITYDEALTDRFVTFYSKEDAERVWQEEQRERNQHHSN